MIDKIKQMTKKQWILIAGCVIGVICIIVAALTIGNAVQEKRLTEQLELGEKYLAELDYEAAIVAYELAIRIDPKCEEAYIQLATAYLATGQRDKAIEVLEKGVVLISSEELQAYLQRILSHEWQPATCDAPKTCVLCGATEGEVLEHKWQPATCDAPKTCVLCGAIEGEVLEHKWQEATCDTAKTCDVCGATEGEALGHTWVEANYQAPKTCSVCEETEGEPLIASFEEHGMVINAEEGVTYDYVTTCSTNTSKKTVGHLTFSDYQIAETVEGFESKEGYEWRTVHATIVFDDANAFNYGPSYSSCIDNYFDVGGWDNSSHFDEDSGLRIYTVNYYGTDYTECAVAFMNDRWSGWINNTITFEADIYVRVPVGYDGVVVGFYDSAIKWAEGMHIYDIADENTLFFRLK